MIKGQVKQMSYGRKIVFSQEGPEGYRAAEARYGKLKHKRGVVGWFRTRIELELT